MPTIRQIEAFRAVMLTRSMTAAAQMLSVTQPAVSKIMKELQNDVGFSLFVRRQGGLEPSAEALALFAEVERVFVGVERVNRTADRIKARHHGQLRIVAMSAVTSFLIGKVVRTFKARHPGISVSIETYNSPEVIDLVASGQCELGYAVTPVSSDAVSSRKLYNTNLVCILPKGHRLQAQSTIDLRELADEEFISVLGWNTTRLTIDAAFRAADVSRRLNLEAGWSATVSSLVAEGLGVAIIEPFTAELSAKCGCIVRSLEQPIEFSFAEISAKTAAPNELVEAFSTAFAEELEKFIVPPPEQSQPIRS